MTPSPTSNPDLGELVARLREFTYSAEVDGQVEEWHPAVCLEAADALAASNLRAEELKAESVERCREQQELFVRAKIAEAEAAGLKARVAEVLEPFGAFADHAIDGDGWGGPPGRIVDWFGPSDFRRAAELHAAVSGEGK